MKEITVFFVRHIRQYAAAYLVLFLTLIPSVLAYHRVRINVSAREGARFEKIVEQRAQAIERRLTEYMEELLAVRGLFAASRDVRAEEWGRFLAALDIDRRYPGIRSVAFLERVPYAEKNRVITRMHGAGVADFDIKPDGDREVYYPVIFLTRFDGQTPGGIGRDHFANAERRAVIEQAISTDQPTATGMVTFLAEDTNSTQRGTVIYLPVFGNAPVSGGDIDRPAELRGVICATFIPEHMLRAVFSSNPESLVALKVFEGDEAKSEKVIYDEIHSRAEEESMSSPRLRRQLAIPVVNRNWVLEFSTRPAFEAESQHYLPALVLACGLVGSFLLFGIVLVQVKARARSEQMAASLRKSEAALATEKERLAVTLDSLREGVITTEKTGHVLSINIAGQMLTGWPQAEAAGRPIDEVFHSIHAKSRERRVNPVKHLLREGRAAGHEDTTILIARDGTELPIADSVAPIHDKNGEVQGAVVVFRDITEEQKTEAEILKESKLESVGLLAGGIAHDYNNILTAIIGNISLARMSAHSTDALLERLAGVEKAAWRAKELTQQLLTFARGGSPIKKAAQLSQLLREAVQFALRGTNVESEFSLPDNLWIVEVDEGQFRQIINNIVINSVQAMPGGGRLFVQAENVEVSPGFSPSLKAGRCVKVTLRDEGAGIAPEHLSRIFDPYFTTKKQASGLGLSAAYSVIKKHGGHIEAESRPGAGTTIRIHLAAAVRPAVAAPASDVQQERFFGQGRILVMDDESDILTVLEAMLKASGYEVGKAKDGAEALELYKTAKAEGRPYSAVIMDLTIPNGMGGKEAVQRLKEMDPDAKAIVSSGYSYDPVMSDFRKYGFSGVMPKPYRMEEMSRILREVLSEEPAGKEQ